ncbi:MAG TPA: lipopolysaccharide assembly protein LapA domain-containing protein [Candidatus Limnocylindrales bacterium]|nr:lipopolysaccharide assembly protein LapA domain-containing protein [Candidatus Limnocylindrales bacterium]
MFSLIVAILFGLSITFFAFQNAAGVPIVLGNFFLPNTPVYLVVIVSLLVGILMAWFISAIEGMSHFMNIRRKDSVIKDDRKSIAQMEDRIKKLEVENASLRHNKENREVVVENKHSNIDHNNHSDTEYHEVTHKPSFFERIFPSSTKHYSKQV